jgi:hypothetical protein
VPEEYIWKSAKSLLLRATKERKLESAVFKGQCTKESETISEQGTKKIERESLSDAKGFSTWGQNKTMKFKL